MEVYRVQQDELQQITESEISSEKRLEEHLIKSKGATIGGVDLLYIGQQGSPAESGIFDLIAVDEYGDTVIIELKRDRAPREIVTQALEYAAGIRHESYMDLEDRYKSFLEDKTAETAEPILREEHAEYFNKSTPLTEREFNNDQRLIVVGREFRDVSLDMADFLREHGIDVICVAYKSYEDEAGLQILTTEGIRRPLPEEPESVTSSSGGSATRSEYIVELLDGEDVVECFEDSSQKEIMIRTVDCLITDHDLVGEIEIPYVPGSGRGDRALLNNEPQHTDGREMKRSKELTGGYHLLTVFDAKTKKRYTNELAQQCGFNARFSGDW